MKKFKILIVAMLLILFNINISTHANEISLDYKRYEDGVKNILVVNSYDPYNEWEKSISEGFNDYIQEQEQFFVNVENVYVDIDNIDNHEYIENFKELLNSKYKKHEFDLVLAVDDQAFNLIRKELFNEECIFYKSNILFVGVNQEIYLSEEEKKYITGFNDVQNLVQVVSLITNLHAHLYPIETVNILVDNTFYNEKIAKDLVGSSYLLTKDVNINFVKGEYSDDILQQMKYINEENEAIVLSGIYKDAKTDKYIDPKEFISQIRNIKDIPIYTDRQEYVDKGVIGGYVDIGYENGHSAAKMAVEILKGKSISDIPVTNEPIAKYIFDYNKIYDYNANPLEVPRESIMLNQKFYQLLIPSQVKVMIWTTIILVASLIIGIISIMNMGKKENLKNKKLYQMAKDREQLKTDFIANMSHELRTPLNVITSISKLLELKANKDEVDTEYLLEKLDRINQNSSRLTRLVNNLIDITKFDSGFYECKYENVNIVYVIEDIVSESVDFANSKNIDIIFDTEEEVIITYIDQEKIERAVLNLISNAIKFTHEDGVIEVNIKRDKEFVVIIVKDNGIGIEEEKLKQIFHRFYQIDSLLSRRHEGSGLGLCIVDEIIKMHDGKIEVYSEKNEGTTFKLILPIKISNEIVSYKDIQNRDFKDVVKLEMSDIDK